MAAHRRGACLLRKSRGRCNGRRCFWHRLGATPPDAGHTMSIANRQQRVMPKRTDAVRRGAQATEMMDAMAGDLSGWIDGVDRGGGGGAGDGAVCGGRQFEEAAISATPSRCVGVVPGQQHTREVTLRYVKWHARRRSGDETAPGLQGHPGCAVALSKEVRSSDPAAGRCARAPVRTAPRRLIADVARWRAHGVHRHGVHRTRVE